MVSGLKPISYRKAMNVKQTVQTKAPAFIRRDSGTSFTHSSIMAAISMDLSREDSQQIPAIPHTSRMKIQSYRLCFVVRILQAHETIAIARPA